MRTLWIALVWTAAAMAMQAGVDGTWEVPDPSRPNGVIIELKTDGPTLTGSFSGPNGKLDLRNGRVEGDEVRFELGLTFRGRSITEKFRGRVSGDELVLTGEMPGIEHKMVAKRRSPEAPPPDWFSAPAAPDAVIAWLKSNAMPLDDLALLKARLKDARIVAMGEATHATHEFQILKDRVFRMLVEDLGFTVFAIESPWATSQATDDFVQGKTTSLPDALNGHYNWWRTEEFADLLRWMRAYNLDPAHTRKVKFVGFDVRGATLLEDRVLGYLGKVDRAAQAEASRVFQDMPAEAETPSYQQASDEVHRRVNDGLAALLRKFDATKQEYVARSSEREWAFARQSVVVLQQTERKGRAGDNSGLGERDEAMAANVKWILDHEQAGTKVMLWAHNGHVADEAAPSPSMGSYLRKTYADAMTVIGFAFGEGSFRAIPAGTGVEKTFTVGPPPRGSLDATLAAVGMPLFAVDLRTAEGAVKDWLDAPHISRQIGGEYSEATAPIYFQQKRARTAFDILIYVAKTSGTRPL